MWLVNSMLNVKDVVQLDLTILRFETTGIGGCSSPPEKRCLLCETLNSWDAEPQLLDTPSIYQRGVLACTNSTTVGNLRLKACNLSCATWTTPTQQIEVTWLTGSQDLMGLGTFSTRNSSRNLMFFSGFPKGDVPIELIWSMVNYVTILMSSNTQNTFRKRNNF